MVLQPLPERRLEDRVLDVIQAAKTACSLESVRCDAVRFGWGRSRDCEDAFTLAALIRDKGWIECVSGQTG